MKTLFVIAALTACLSAHATPGNNGEGNGGCGVGQQTNGCGSTGGAGGQGGSVVGSGNSSNVNQQGQAQAQFQGQSVSNSGNSSAYGQGGSGGYATGGDGGTAAASAAGGNGAGNQTSVSVAGAVYEAAASTAYAPDGKAPRTSCRIFVGLGGSNLNGSLSGGLPIGNDQTCMSGAQIEAMDKANKVQAGTFLIADYLIAICAMEGMERMAGCTKK